MSNEKVLMLTEFYVPGFKGGGPIKSVNNIVKGLSDDFDFEILTSDRDVGDELPYSGIRFESWDDKIYYVNKRKIGLLFLYKVIKDRKPTVFYINSFFNFRFSILPILLFRLGLIKLDRVVIAPRGEFSKGALQLKFFKKKLYIILFNVFLNQKSLIWQATSKDEITDIKLNVIKSKIILARNIVDTDITGNINRVKEIGALNIIFLSRISAKKNLIYALEVIAKLKGDITFDIYGPIEDSNYWESCKKSIERLPDNIKCGYKGKVKRDDVKDVFNRYHVFLFPTKGENFGHVIFESMTSLCPAIISDQTPWNDLNDYNCGWTINLNNKSRFNTVLSDLIQMNQENYSLLLKNLKSYVSEYDKRNTIDDYYKLFNALN